METVTAVLLTECDPDRYLDVLDIAGPAARKVN